MTNKRTAPIPGFDGVYSITDNGEVISHRNNKVLAGACIKVKNRAYKFVCLRNKNEKKNVTAYVHRLVAEAFVEKSDPSHNMVIFKDDDTQNMHYSNLVWTDSKGVSEHSKRNRNGAGYIKAKMDDDTRRELVKQLFTTPTDKAFRLKHRKLVTDDDFKEYGLPVEIFDSSTRIPSDMSVMEFWEFYSKVFKLIRSDLSLQTIANSTGLHISSISLIKSGKRHSTLYKAFCEMFPE